MTNIIRLIGLTFMFWPINAFASDNAWNYSFGISVKQLALDVYEKGQTDPEGILTDDFRVFPELGFESNITYFSNSSCSLNVNLDYYISSLVQCLLDCFLRHTIPIAIDICPL